MDTCRVVDKRWSLFVVFVTGLAVTALTATAAQSSSQPGRSGPPPVISLEELKPLHAAGGVLVVDVRSEESYRTGRIAGAMHVPLAAVESRASEVRAAAKGRPIVTYCSCVGEHLSLAAAEHLASRGLVNVKALVGGYPAWVLGGGAVDKGR